MPKPYFQNSTVSLFHDDAFEILPQLSPTFAACITDPPYGIGACKWDKPISPDAFFQLVWPLLAENAPIVSFADLRFAGKLVASPHSNFRYDLVWQKPPVGYLNARVMPMRAHENILVCYRKKPVYNPQMSPRKTPIKYAKRTSSSENYTHGVKHQSAARISTSTFPTSVVYFPRLQQGLHPTAKPVALIAWLIKTYTRDGATIIDPFAGSGTAGVAAMQTGRKAVLIERDERYCEIAANRLETAQNRPNPNPHNKKSHFPPCQSP